MGFLDGLKGAFGGGAGGGGGGLLSGMGGKLHDAWAGTDPVMQATERPDLMNERVGPIHQMPQIEATGGTTGGLLSKMQTPDARGLTFGDKLFASGSILQGDSGGAASYIQNQRSLADRDSQRGMAKETAEKGLAALRGNIDPATGQLNVRGYLDALPPGSDPMDGLKMRDALRPDVTPMSGPDGSLYGFNRGTGTFTQGVAGRPKPPGQLIQDEDGNWGVNPQFVQLQEQVAAAKRRGAPLAGRAPRAPASTGRPAGY